jgi:hypothetical protein
MGKCDEEGIIWQMHQESWEDLVPFDYPCHGRNFIQGKCFSIYLLVHNLIINIKCCEISYNF